MVVQNSGLCYVPENAEAFHTNVSGVKWQFRSTRLWTNRLNKCELWSKAFNKLTLFCVPIRSYTVLPLDTARGSILS